MIFPESDRVVYGVDTIAEVICQLQFPQIWAIASDPPTSFQEAIREEYPLYERQAGFDAPPQIAEMLSQLQVGPPGESVRHHFSTPDSKRSITLTAQFVAVSERSYTEWADLKREIERAREALEEVYKPAFYTRTGLRYQDVIDRKLVGLEDRPWSELLNPAVAGYLGEPAFAEHVTEAAASVLFKDPEAPETFVRLQHGLVARNGEPSNLLYSIDADYHTQRRLDGGSVRDVLDRFNKEAGNLFRWSTSDLLRDALGQRHGVANADG
jgi:uncharacterized protein (TIGR04255 family)